MKVCDEGGPEARIMKLRQLVTGLIRYERIEPHWTSADEARGYAERVSHETKREGERVGVGGPAPGGKVEKLGF